MLMDIWVILALEITHITVDDYKLLSAWTIPESEESSDMLESKNVPETLEDIIYHWRREAEYKMIQNMSNSSAASCPEVKGMSDEKVCVSYVCLYYLPINCGIFLCFGHSFENLFRNSCQHIIVAFLYYTALITLDVVPFDNSCELNISSIEWPCRRRVKK